MLNIKEGTQYGCDIEYLYKKRVYVFKRTEKIYNVSTFAGGKQNQYFRNAHIYSNKYGGKITEWYKVKGYALSENKLLEIHWVEHQKYGKFRGKIKRVLKKESRHNKWLLSFLLSKNN